MSRNFSPLLFAVAGAAVAWWLLTPRGDPADKARITVLEGEVTRLEGEIVKREVQLKYLRQRRRVARVDQVVRIPEPESQGGSLTSFRFQEVDEAGLPLGPAQPFTIRGDIAYFEALVVKFDDAFVEQNDLLKGSSLLLFRRVFGEHQAPADGFPLDAVGQRPAGYESDPAAGSLFYQDLWSRFWEYSLDPEVVRQAGVRAMHGEAPFVKLAPGKAYEIDLRSSEGLVITVVDDPGPAASSLH
jgi:hypothetical protein